MTLSTNWRIPDRRGAGLLALLITFLPLAAASAEPQFAVSTIPAARDVQQTVVPVWQPGRQQADLAVASVDRHRQRHLELVRAENGEYGEVVASRPLADDILVLDGARIGGEDRLLGFSRTEAFILDPVSGQRSGLAKISSIYSAPVYNLVPRLDLARDLNDDGRDDLIIPGFDGFMVYIQAEDGRFHDPVSTAAPPLVDMSYNDFPWYQPRQVFLADLTLDGRRDLGFWTGDALDIYAQDGNGLFRPQVVRIPAGVEAEYDGLDELSAALSEQDQSDARVRAVFTVNDFDGDGIVDLLVLTVRSEGVFRKRSTFELYRGQRQDGLLQFSATPVSTITSKGLQFESLEEDFNRDGQKDMVISTVELGIGKVLGALITGSIKIDLDFYQMQEGSFPERPDLRREVTATFDLGSGDFFFPTVLLADVDGDAIDDLLVQDGEDTLNIYVGGATKGIFARRPIAVKVSMPGDPDLVDAVDLNRDGRTDLVMRHAAARSERKVVVLVSQP